MTTKDLDPIIGRVLRGIADDLEEMGECLGIERELIESELSQEAIFGQACFKLCAFIRGCEETTAQEDWARAMTPERYFQLRDALIELRYAEWVNADDPGQGWQLTRPASEVIEAIFGPDALVALALFA